jgi:predicted secreted protein
MKKVIVLSHCILNSFCELDEPANKKLYDQLVISLIEREIGILQLPCPELSFQGLNRKSITPQDVEAEEYRVFCQDILESTLRDLKEYAKNGVDVIKLVGIETSPSCSALDSESIMMKELITMMAREGIAYSKIDMPHGPVANVDKFIEEILA